MFGQNKSSAKTLDHIHRAYKIAIADITHNADLTDEEKEFARNGVKLDYRNALAGFYRSLF